MAAKIGALYAELTADSGRFTKALIDAGVRVKGFETKTNQSFKRVDSVVSGTLGNLAGGLAAAFSVQQIGKFIDSATRIQNALRIAGLSGAELTKVYEALYAAAQKNGVPVEALATLYGRASQAQKELGASTEDLISFSSNVALALRVAGTDAQTASGALLQLGQALGSGRVAAEEFNSVLEGAPTIVKAVAAGLKEAGGSVSALKALIVDGKVSSEAFFRAFESGAPILEKMAQGSTLTLAQQFTQLQNVLTDAVGKFDAATGASGKLGTELRELAGFVTSLGNAFATTAESDLGKFIGKVYEALEAARKFRDFFGGVGGTFTAMNQVMYDAVNGREIGSTTVQTSRDAAITSRIDGAFESAAPKSGRLKQTAPVAQVEPVSLADFKAPTSKTKTAKERADEYARMVERIRESTTATQAETAAIAKLDPTVKDYGYTLAKTRAEQDLLSAALKAGKTVTPELRAEIEKISEAYATAEAASNKLGEAQSKALDEIEARKDLLSGALSDIRSALEDGKLSWQELGDVALNVLNKVIDRLQNDLVDALIGSKSSTATGGGLIAGLLGGIGKLFGFDAGGYTGDGGKYDPAGIVHRGEFVFTKEATAKAGAGNLAAMMGYLETGDITKLIPSGMPGFADGGAVSDLSLPSLEAPSRAAAKLGQPMLGTLEQSAPQPTSLDINVSGAMGNAEIMQMVRSGVEQGLKAYNKVLPYRVREINANPNKVR